jgi:hypothetical protein
MKILITDESYPQLNGFGTFLAANNPIPYTSPEAVFPAVAGHPEKRSDEGPALAFS